MREVAQPLAEEQQNGQDDRRKHDLRDLTARARGLGHRRLGRTSVDDKGAADRCGDVGRCEPEKIVVDVLLLAVLIRIRPGRGKALRDDHHEAGQRNRDKFDRFPPGHLGQARYRQAACDLADERKPKPLEIERIAGPDRGRHRDERHGKTRPETPGKQDARHHDQRNRDRGAMRLQQVRGHDQQLLWRARGMHGDFEHDAQHRDPDLDSDAGKETHQHGARHEVRKEPQAKDTRHHEQGRHHQRQHGCQVCVVCCPPGRHQRKLARHDRRGRGIGRHHQVPRGAKDGKGNQGKERGVETRHRRHARDAGVTEHLGNIHRCERNARETIAHEARARQRTQPTEQINPHT